MSTSNVKASRKFAQNLITPNMLRYRAKFSSSKVVHDTKLREVYRKWRLINPGMVAEFKHDTKDLELDSIVSLFNIIDWSTKISDADFDPKLRPVGKNSLAFIDYKSAPRATKKWNAIKSYASFDKSKYDPNHWWAIYSKFHMEAEQHHMDYWHLNAGRASFNDTIELCVDEMVSAMRIREHPLDAFTTSMEWKFSSTEISGGTIYNIRDKYKRLDPSGLLYFILFCAGHGFSDTCTKYIYNYSQIIRSHKYPFEQVLALNQMLENPFDEKHWVNVYINHMNSHFGYQRSAFKDMLRESQMHIVGVQDLYREIMGKNRMHDHSKTNFFMNTCLALKFLNYKAPADQDLIPYNLRSVDGVSRVKLTKKGSVETNFIRQFPTCTSGHKFAYVSTGYLPTNSDLSKLCHSMSEYIELYITNRDETGLFLKPELRMFLLMQSPSAVECYYTYLRNGQMPVVLLQFAYTYKETLDLFKKYHTAFQNTDLNMIKILYHKVEDLSEDVVPRPVLPTISRKRKVEEMVIDISSDEDERPTECMRTAPVDLNCMQFDMLSAKLDDNLNDFYIKTRNYFDSLDLSLLTARDKEIVECLKDAWLPQLIFDDEQFKLQDFYMSRDDFVKLYKKALPMGPALSESINNFNTLTSKLTSLATGIDLQANNKVFTDLRDLLSTTLLEYRVLASQTSSAVNTSSNNLNTSFTQAMDKIKAMKPEDLASQFSVMMNGMVDMADIVKSFFKKLNFFLPNFVEPFGFSLDSIKNVEFGDITACVILYLFYINTTGDLKYVYLFGLLYKLGILHQLLKGARWVLENLGFSDAPSETYGAPDECFFSMDPIVSIFQYIFCDHKYVTALIAVTFIVGFMGYSHLHTANIKNVADFHNIVVRSSRDVGYIGNGLTGATKIFGYVAAGCTVASKWILNEVFKKEFKTADEILVNNLQTWMTNVEFYDSQAGRNLICADIRFLNVAKLLYPKGIAFRDAALTDKLPKGTLQAITAYVKKSKVVYEFCQMISNTKNGRPCTQHVCFEGPSNIGKSALLPAVVDVVNRTFDPHRKSESFAITPQMINSDDWDNYRSNIPVVTIDDLNAIREPKEAALVICMCSNCMMTVPVAALDQKGQQFESQTLITTTNRAFPGDLGDILRTPDAYFNRFKHCYKVERNPAYDDCFDSAGRFSISKFKTHHPSESADLRGWLLFTHQSWDRDSHSVVTAVDDEGKTFVKGTYAQMLDHMIDRLKKARESDPFKDNDKRRMYASVKEWFQNVRMCQCSLEEDHGISFPLVDEIARATYIDDFVSNYDHQLIDTYSTMALTLTDTQVETFCEKDRPSETSYSSIDKFWSETTAKAKFHAFLDPEHYVFKLDETFMSELAKIHDEPIDSRLIFCNDAPIDNQYPDICMPKEFKRVLTCAAQLRKKPTLLVGIPEEEEKKIITYVSINSNQTDILLKPSFMAAMRRYLDAPSAQRIRYFRKEIADYANVSPLLDSLKKNIKDCAVKVKGFCSQITDIARAFKDWILTNWKINITLLFAFGGCVWMLQRMARIFLGPEETAAYSNRSNDKVMGILKPAHRSEILGQPSYIADHIKQQNDKLQKNQFMLVGERGAYCHGLGLKGDLAVVNFHSVCQLFDNQVSSVTYSLYRHPNYAACTRIVLTISDVKRSGTKDLCFIKLHAVNFRDITSSLPNFKNYPKDIRHTPVCIYSMNKAMKTTDNRISTVSDYHELYNYTTNNGNTYAEIHHVILKYGVQKGKSGSFIAHALPNNNTRILGLISSASHDATHVTSIMQEEALDAFDDLGCVKIDGPIQIMEMSEMGEKFSQYFEDHVHFVGEVPPNLQVSPYGKIEHFPSPISQYIEFQRETEPAILDIKDPRSRGIFPLAKSVGKRSRDVKEPYPADIAIPARESIKRDICMRGKRWFKRVCDPFTAVTGRRIEGYSPMDLTTSSGLPYLKNKVKPGKKDLIEFDQFGNISKFAPSLLSEITQTIESMKQGVVPRNSAYDFPKSEDLPLKKITDVKTRSITNSNILYSILYRMHFMDFDAFMHVLAKNGTYWYCPGINPESPAWENIYYKLRANNRKGWCFDVSNFDGGFDYQMFEAYCEAVNAFYDDGPENARVRACIIFNALCGYVQIGPLIYSPTRGLGSGFAGTTSGNTVSHMFRMFCAYIRLARLAGQEHLANWMTFLRFVIAYFYGDDIIFTIAADIISWFNGNTIAKEYQRCGWKVTMGVDKVEVSVDDPIMLSGIPIEDLNFLKRGFKHIVGVPFVTCPLDLTSINAMLHWVRHGKTNTPIAQFFENVYAALFAVYHHGREVFDKYLFIINKALSSSGLEQINLSFSEVNQIMIYRYYGELVNDPV